MKRQLETTRDAAFAFVRLGDAITATYFERAGIEFGEPE